MQNPYCSLHALFLFSCSELLRVQWALPMGSPGHFGRSGLQRPIGVFLPGHFGCTPRGLMFGILVFAWSRPQLDPAVVPLPNTADLGTNDSQLWDRRV